ncbi:MAG: hypothetical protein Kow0063_04490 [Anaerolineae bacterium]
MGFDISEVWDEQDHKTTVFTWRWVISRLRGRSGCRIEWQSLVGVDSAQHRRGTIHSSPCSLVGRGSLLYLFFERRFAQLRGLPRHI